MDDFDDYFPDDIVLDEQTLAVLDQEEQRFLTQRNSLPAAVSTPLSPVVKRLKTDRGWSPGVGSPFLGDELPEISLIGEGDYGLGTRVSAAADASRYKSTRINANSNTTSGSGTFNPAPAQSGPSFCRNPVIPAHASSTRLVYQKSTSSIRFSQPPHEVSHGSTSIPLLLRPGADKESDGDHRHLDDHMKVLERKLEELREENERIQNALKEATEAKLAKEGEVTILRKNIEKTSMAHAAQISKLKGAKEEADAKQVQMQMQMQEDMERLKTQFIFKQHELETSIRKPPPSVRSKKIFREPPGTPINTSSQIRGWNLIAGPSRVQAETPLRPPRRESKQPFRSPQQAKSPGKPKRPAKLPGFQNSFVTSTPIRSPENRMPKENETFGGGDFLYPSQVPNSFQILPPNTLLKVHPEEDEDVEEDIVIPAPSAPAMVEMDRAVDGDGDTAMLQVEDEETVLEELEVMTPINWKAELCRCILTHSVPGCGILTFQTLLGLSVSSSLNAAAGEAYSTACTRILEIIANTSNAKEYDASLEPLCKSFVSITAVLSVTELILPLASLLDLLTTLTYSLPRFSSTLLAQKHLENDEEEQSHILVSLCEIIEVRLAPSCQHEQRDTLADKVLSLLESLCFHVGSDSIKRLAYLPNHPEAFATLLQSSQPSWVLARCSQLLILLATYPMLFRSLLSIPEPELQQAAQDTVKVPHIERMCSYLIDTSRQDTEFHAFKSRILTFFALLSMSHSDAHMSLVKSYTLIPSLVVFLAQLTAPLWEDDEKLISSSEATTLLIYTINQTLFLLYHLVFAVDPAINLRHKIHHAPHRLFNSLTHIFVVTFGRLSYADPPEWIDVPCKAELELLSEMARDLLDLVVDGPEGDSVWSAYQMELDEGNVTDEEEMEAKLIGDDN